MQLQGGCPHWLARRHVWLQADLSPLTPACRQSSAQHDFADPLPRAFGVTAMWTASSSRSQIKALVAWAVVRNMIMAADERGRLPESALQ